MTKSVARLSGRVNALQVDMSLVRIPRKGIEKDVVWPLPAEIEPVSVLC